MHASLTARKVSIVLSDICLPSPLIPFFQKLFHLTSKKKKKSKKNLRAMTDNEK